MLFHLHGSFDASQDDFGFRVLFGEIFEGLDERLDGGGPEDDISPDDDIDLQVWSIEELGEFGHQVLAGLASPREELADELESEIDGEEEGTCRICTFPHSC